MDGKSLGENVRLTNTILVVNESDLRNIEPLTFVQLLFVLQDTLVEELLQLLVTVVDAELLEAVHLEVFCGREGFVVECCSIV